MEFRIGDVTIFLPQLHITIIAIIVIILLVRWNKQLEKRNFFKIFIYFFISTWIAPIFSWGNKTGTFELYIPLGFIVVLIYLLNSRGYHPSKMKASVLGLCIALYRIVLHYVG
ncbi:hypothetical protein NC661_11120 [Aquibacillus koreensis]|uniref:Uncharacterized protein n=1 Tax=Aquibacillus koreensis TaxID=279446 RepID=A0A9X3WPD0_9BACI|nr:hypothetical protein [Aquibacillus koreensis]MCT2538137.1 hypothetical protein [Aquibacillus koreensis]MDC3420919.1 hypothetical protein [Aquibacillus koreensis]